MRKLISASTSLILLIAKPTWISTQSPASGRSSCSKSEIHFAAHSQNVNHRQVAILSQQFDDFSGYGEAHVFIPAFAPRYRR